MLLCRGNAGLLAALEAAQRQAAALQRSLEERSERAAEEAAEAGARLATERRKLVQAEASRARTQREAAQLQGRWSLEQAMHAKTAEQLAAALKENEGLCAALEVAAHGRAEDGPDQALEGMRAVLRVVGMARSDGDLQQLLLDALHGG
jgi:hypothetical protein